MQIVRRSSFTAMPWKNGGGVTYEVIRVPAAAEAFNWRLSVAEIAVSGPFSLFFGYDRTLVLLQGAGVRLTVDAASPVSLTNVGDLAKFDGASTTDCQLVNGSCTDLNLMVARSRHSGARVECIRERRVLPALPRDITLVFGISGRLWVEPVVEPGAHWNLRAHSERGANLGEGANLGDGAHLEPWDLAILPAGGSWTVVPEPERNSSSLVFFATLDDNSVTLDDHSS